MKDKIIEILYRWASGKGTNLPKIDIRKAPDIADEIIAELSRLKEEKPVLSKVTNEAINRLAKDYARDHSNAPDKDCPEWIIHDFEAGAYAVRTLLTGIINLTDEGLKEKEVTDDSHTCCICHKNWVDSDNGYDTCNDCLNNI